MKTTLTFTGHNDLIAFLNVVQENGIFGFVNMTMEMTNTGNGSMTITTDEDATFAIIDLAWKATEKGEHIHPAYTLTVDGVDFTEMLDDANIYAVEVVS